MSVNQFEELADALKEGERGTDPVSAVPDKQISLLDLFIVIVKRRQLIIRVALCIVLAGLIISLLLPARYTASTSILPPQQNSSAGAAMMAQLGSLGSIASLGGSALGMKNPNDLQVAMLKSRTVEDAMINRFHLQDRYKTRRKSDARKKFEQYVEIDSGSKDGLIRVDVTDRDASYAADMANGYVEEYKKFSATLAVSEASQRRLFFERQLSQAKDNLATAEEELKKTEQKTGLIQLDSQTRAAIQLVAELRAQIAAKQVEISAMRSFATSENPQLQVAEQQLAGLRSQEQKMGGGSEGSSNELVPKGNVQESSIEYVRKLRDVKYYETIFDLLARQYEVAKVDEARQGAVVQVVDSATVPDHRSSPRRTLIVLGAAAFGILLGIIGALATEGFVRLSNNPAERWRMETLRGLFTSGKNRKAQS